MDEVKSKVSGVVTFYYSKMFEFKNYLSSSPQCENVVDRNINLMSWLSIQHNTLFVQVTSEKTGLSC